MTQSIDQAVDDASKWADIPGVVLVGQGETAEGDACIIVKVTTENVARQIPPTFEGFPVIVDVTDEIVAQPGGGPTKRR